MNDMLKNMLVWIVIAVVIMSVFNNFVPQKEGATELSYSEFINQVKDNQIESVFIEADNRTITGTYKNGTSFKTYGLSNDPKLADDLLANGVKIAAATSCKTIFIFNNFNIMVPNAIVNWCLVIFYEANAGRIWW